MNPKADHDKHSEEIFESIKPDEQGCFIFVYIGLLHPILKIFRPGFK